LLFSTGVNYLQNFKATSVRVSANLVGGPDRTGVFAIAAAMHERVCIASLTIYGAIGGPQYFESRFAFVTLTSIGAIAILIPPCRTRDEGTMSGIGILVAIAGIGITR